ncbi:DUF4280 domain-containing protein [Derxia gummosa]|uniref:DUF4280 domain-containing protein n=1 Tax=Derxia gummosa DSM 723 TaxID=1121388 RepID=A0A8B6X285_9BURK|nr:DUF4280 domain-containing protein [Derxia gummosa]
MPMQTVMTATLQCSFGAAPSNLVVLPARTVHSGMQFAANIMDNVPMVNILPFGVCGSLAFPATAAATSAAMGALTPMPCVPTTPTPWQPGVPNLLVDYLPAIDNTCSLMCAWGGVIRITSPGQTTHMVP